MPLLPSCFSARVLVILCLSFLAFARVTTAALVVEGPGGLIYTAYANEGQTDEVNTVPDFSRAGYQGGGVAIPFVPAAVTVSNGPGDDTALIQNAIDQVSALPMGPNGFRGAVFLEAGEYEVGTTLNINASGVVIRGAGQQVGGGTRITFTATVKDDLFFFNGNSGPGGGNDDQSITDDYVPVGSKTLNVADASAYSPGDLIRITNLVNQQWIDDIGMNLVSPAWNPSSFQLRHLRYVVSKNGSELTLDAPIVQAIETQYGGGKVERMTYTGALEQVGIENIRLESSFANDTDEDHGWIAVKMHLVVNGWVRQVTSRYFGRGLFSADNSSMFLTVQDSAALDPKSQTTGGRKYSFQIDDSTYNLVQRCLTRGGRHDFVSGSKTPGPNVFADSLATEARSDTGPHFRYATGELYDNIKSSNDINVQNRFNSGTSHGWSGAQVMFWNVEADDIRCDAPTGAMNWSVGAVGNKAEGNFGAQSAAEPFGIWESEGIHVMPRSLYYAQLEERRGPNALHDVTLPQQKSGTIWTELETWDGDGLLLDPVICGVDLESGLIGLNTPIDIRARVRDLVMRENLSSVTWSQVSGPGTVTFADSAALETTASFSATGQYELQLLAEDGSRQVSGSVLVNAIDQNDETPPAAPGGLVPTPGFNFVSLDWDDSAEADLLGYSVYRSETSGSYGAPIAVGVASSSYVDSTALNGTTYHYVVTAADVNGNESAESAEVSAVPVDNDPPPEVSFVEPTDGQSFLAGSDLEVTVNASDLDGTVSGVELFLDGVLVRQENQEPWTWNVGGQNDESLNNLPLGTYELEAVATDDDSQTSSAVISVTIEPDTLAPVAPVGLTAVPADSYVTLDWSDNSEEDLAVYSIYRSTVSGSSGTPLITGLTSSDYIDDSAENDTTYFYTVTATDSSGNESERSAEASATPQSFQPVTIFGTDEDRFGGFGSSAEDGTEAWALTADSARYAFGTPGSDERYIASLLKAYAFDRAVGRSYTIEGVVDLTEGYGDDNNRIGILLFNANETQTADGGGLYLRLNTDDDKRIKITDGINGTALASVGTGVTNGDSWIGQTLTFTADLAFTEVSGTEKIDIDFTLTDGNQTTTTLAAQVDAASYPAGISDLRPNGGKEVLTVPTEIFRRPSTTRASPSRIQPRPRHPRVWSPSREMVLLNSIGTITRNPIWPAIPFTAERMAGPSVCLWRRINPPVLIRTIQPKMESPITTGSERLTPEGTNPPTVPKLLPRRTPF